MSHKPNERRNNEQVVRPQHVDKRSERTEKLSPKPVKPHRLDGAREQLAAWMIARSFGTGHGDTLEDLLKELSWQVEELRAKVGRREVG